MPVIGTLAAVSARGFGFGTEDMFGEQVFTSSGTYTFYVPSGVTALSMVAIGGGAGGGKAGNYTSEALPLVFNNPPGSSPTTYRAGGGGGLAYSNAVSVTPGQPLTVVVGDGGFTFTVPQDGGDSYVQTAAAVKLVHAGGGKGAASGGVVVRQLSALAVPAAPAVNGATIALTMSIVVVAAGVLVVILGMGVMAVQPTMMAPLDLVEALAAAAVVVG